MGQVLNQFSHIGF